MTHTNPPEITRTIQAELDRIEAEEDVRVLYACESGSRAWGFASADSDFDVRFLYLRPAAWYLTIQRRRDVIERPIGGMLDISGWDLPKALELFRKSNPPLFEWLQSPIVYRESGSAVARLRSLLPEYYSPLSCMHHYLHMARGNNREFLRGDDVWLKKYFYVLRPVLACLWIEAGYGAVPTEFAALLERIAPDGPVRRAVDRLLDDKRSGKELDRGRRIPEISEFLDAQIERLTADNLVPAQTKDPNRLDTLFVEVLVETFGPALRQAKCED